jgi:hypothetical protein
MPENNMLNVVWGIPNRTRANCYVFGLGPNIGKGGYYARRTQKARPGDKCESGPKCCYRGKSFKFNNCKEFIHRIVCDNPKHVQQLAPKTSWKTQLPHGFHMMAAILSPEGHQDFHFLRRFDIDQIRKAWRYLKGRTPVHLHRKIYRLFKIRDEHRQRMKHPPRIYLWAHQRGWMEGGPILVDAANRLIRDVKKANFNYDGLHYKVFCRYLQVRTRFATVTKEFDV